MAPDLVRSERYLELPSYRANVRNACSGPLERFGTPEPVDVPGLGPARRAACPGVRAVASRRRGCR